MAEEYRYTWPRKLTNGLMEAVLRLGFGPPGIWLLSVKGRRTGKTYETPVSLVERDGSRYLVSPYGERSWVRNARASGEVGLRRGRTRDARRIEEVPAADAVPVLKDYWHENAITRSFFEVGPEAPETALIAEAARHPVFRLVEA
ncbi:MAG TPA: nitroreductase family deazaflavin-dependent oxidoreductase [Dehalococcoidia bacterium]|nr:nitroreductase family deazaflavin-dependent oxidoreductase [Dehalococcoidia bacterium]